MSVDKIKMAALMNSKDTLSQDFSDVVKSLDETAWSDIDIESKVRDKLQEFAAELQIVKMSRDDR